MPDLCEHRELSTLLDALESQLTSSLELFLDHYDNQVNAALEGFTDLERAEVTSVARRIQKSVLAIEKACSEMSEAAA